ELDFLNKRYSSGSPEFIILYGRRRVGKTELIKQFIKDKPSVYFMADRQVERESLGQMQKRMGAYLNDSLFEKASLGSYFELFSEFIKKTSERVVFVIDEFQYLMESNAAIPSIFQKIWDEVLANTNIFLIICGSSISMMETLMGYKNPLYGRRTGQWMVEMLEFKDAIKFLPNYRLEEQVVAYAILDGIPQYLKQFDDTKTLMENIQDKIIEKGNFLHIEPEFLLKEELREPRNYFLILKAISFGNTKSGEIVNYTQLDKTLVSKYLDTLSVLHIVEKNHPVDTNKERTRDTRYKFSDNFFSFWFRFVYPNRPDIERGETEEVMSIIGKDLNSFIGRQFEKICKEALIEMNKQGQLPFRFKKIGGWWNKNREIDIIAMNEETKEICLCECKWQSAKTSPEVLKQLKEKAKFVDWFNNKKTEYYVVISKSGFTKTAIDYANTENMLLLDMDDLEKIFANTNS
ncbi:MAG: ATP-binding protein, partial [Candidatus Methanoperedenaceae archaeon]|nr:ATP-binding protein [Candidatus Methanoperedenaceae archaeon]